MKEVKLHNTDCSCRIYHSCLFACKLLAYHDPIFVHSSPLLFYAKIEFDPITPTAVYSPTRNATTIESELEIPRTRRNFLPVVLYSHVLYLYFSRYFSPNNRVSPRSYSGSWPVLTLYGRILHFPAELSRITRRRKRD